MLPIFFHEQPDQNKQGRYVTLMFLNQCLRQDSQKCCPQQPVRWGSRRTFVQILQWSFSGTGLVNEKSYPPYWAWSGMFATAILSLWGWRVLCMGIERVIIKPSSGDTPRSPLLPFLSEKPVNKTQMCTEHFIIPSLKLQLLNTYPQMINIRALKCHNQTLVSKVGGAHCNTSHHRK